MRDKNLYWGIPAAFAILLLMVPGVNLGIALITHRPVDPWGGSLDTKCFSLFPWGGLIPLGVVMISAVFAWRAGRGVTAIGLGMAALVFYATWGVALTQVSIVPDG